MVLKKIISILMCILVLLLFIGCSEDVNVTISPTSVSDPYDLEKNTNSPEFIINPMRTDFIDAITPSDTDRPQETENIAVETSKPETTNTMFISTPSVTMTPKETVTSTLTNVTTSTPAPTPTPTPTLSPAPTSSANTPSYSTQVGDVIKFGHYEQDNKNNGKEDIEWLVLAKENNKILVISKYILDCQQYHSSDNNVTWETCTLRSWLNNTFVDTAFSGSEKNKIMTVTVTAENNPTYGTDAGNDVQDKVFLLSISESDLYFSSSSSRQCTVTSYAKAQGTYVYSNGFSWWWLRSPGYNQDHAVDVIQDGGAVHIGRTVDYDYNGVRPVLWIDLSI